MKNNYDFLLLLVIFLIFFTTANAQLKVIQYQLDNGLTVMLNPDPKQSKIAASVAVNTGSKNDPSDATGISHYLEHLLFKGTTTLGTIDYEKEKFHLDSVYYYYDQLGKTEDEEKREKIQATINTHSLAASKYAMPNEFDKLLKSIGSTGINATTSNDLTIYFNTIPTHQINKWLDIYAHRFMEPVFRSFQSELEVVYEEKNRAMDNLQRRVLIAFDQAFYKGHPYGENLTLGTVEHLKNPSLTKMYQYFEDYYVANNMALIIAGDFDAEDLRPMIEKTFGQLKSGELPAKEIKAPRAFIGRELIKNRITPIKVGIMGWHTVPSFHKDQTGMEVISYLLQNESRTGLLDELKQKNKLMEIFSFGEIKDEAGNQQVVFIPKIIGQSLKKGERLVLEQIKRLKTGDFSEEFLQSVKNEMYKDFQRQVENLEGRGYLLSNAFRKGKTWEDIASYPSEIKAVTKEKIMELATAYLGDNYFVMQSRTGFPKKQKLDKPKFKPVKVDQSQESEYAKMFNAIPTDEIKNKFIDFQNDVAIVSLGKESRLYAVNNPINDIYSLQIRFHRGTSIDPQLELLAELFDYAHPKGQSANAFREELSLLGSLLNVEAGGSYFTLSLSGLEDNLAAVLKKLNGFIQAPIIEDDKLKILANTYKTNRKVEKEDGLLHGRAMVQSRLYGEKAPLLNRPSLKSIKNGSAEQLMEGFSAVKNTAVSIHFTGKSSADDLSNLLKKQLSLNWDALSQLDQHLTMLPIEKNEVILLNNKKMVQNTVFFIRTSSPFELAHYPRMQLFNTYYGGGFSGLLTQEIREYRSLAYASSGGYDFTGYPETINYFYTVLGCQADKTDEAVAVAYELIQNMPDKRKRMEMVKNSLKLKQQSTYPDFRDLSSVVEAYMIKGLKEDPNRYAQAQYDQLDFDDLLSFYQKEIQNRPTLLAIYGDLSKVDKAALEKIGPVKELERKDVIVP